MDAQKMLKEMLEQRDILNRAIIAMERVASATNRRGRPPKAITDAREMAGLPKRRGRPAGSKTQAPAQDA